MKQKSIFICSECGNKSPKWMGKCTMCGSWNTMEEEIILPVSSQGTGLSSSSPTSPKKISEIDSSAEIRQSTGMIELDRVLGGGLVKGSFVLVGG
ncbi:MAG: DNA repair protein RadA, partial [Clostridia bacterium]|nr:DNA repair protein RadA [Clostridia bacterium]